MSRACTNSITHLVKIVAREEIEKYLSEYESVDANELATEACKNLSNNLRMRGQLWSKDEDELLVAEVEVAIKTIAASHSRSNTAIKERIRQKDLL